MPDQIFINIALLAVGVAIGALLGETSRQQHDRQLFREYINFMTESEHNNELLFREVIRFQTEKGANHEKEYSPAGARRTGASAPDLPLLRQGVRYIPPRCANVHRLPLRGYDFTGTWPCAV